MTKYFHRSLPLFACVAILLLYWPGLQGGYVFDDFSNIVHNDALQMQRLSFAELLRAAFSSESGPLARPLSVASFALERHFFGLDPFPMKLTNVLIHIVNMLLAFALLRVVLERIQQRSPAVRWVVSPVLLALLVAFAWALAPINLTSVLYVVQRMESLATLFMLAGLLAYVRGRSWIDAGRAGPGWALVVGGLGGGLLLGVLSKESAVMLPLHALLVEWLVFRFGAGRSVLRQQLLWLYALVLVLPGLAGTLSYLPAILSGAGYAGRSFDLSERLWTQAHVLWHYLAWIVVPSPGGLSLYHDAFPVARGWLQPWTTLPAGAGLLALVVGAVWWRRRMPVIAFGVLWFFVMHLLVSSVFPLELVFEHRNYLPSLGIILAVFSVLLAGAEDDPLAGVRKLAVCGLIVFYGFVCFLRVGEWSDPFRQAYFEAERQLDSPRAQHALGLALVMSAPGLDSMVFSQAMERFERAAALPGSTLTPLQALVLEHARNGLPTREAWWRQMQTYAGTTPLSAQDLSALRQLVEAFAAGWMRSDADYLADVLREAWLNNPRRAVVAALYARFLFSSGKDIPESGRLLQRSVTLAPGSALRWGELVLYQIATEQHAEAQSSLERMRELNRFDRWSAWIGQLEEQVQRGSANHGREVRP